jgi:hypothetical protein
MKAIALVLVLTLGRLGVLSDDLHSGVSLLCCNRGTFDIRHCITTLNLLWETLRIRVLLLVVLVALCRV